MHFFRLVEHGELIVEKLGGEHGMSYGMVSLDINNQWNMVEHVYCWLYLENMHFCIVLPYSAQYEDFGDDRHMVPQTWAGWTTHDEDMQPTLTRIVLLSHQLN